ncbi:MAG: winged helix-turn-helix domain-containing protein [Candidatus Sedimenticola sp. 20ELBAFRAG]
MNQYSSEIFSVGEWRVVPPDNEIHRTDDLVQLEPKVMALLVYLAENAGKTVSREELFDALWPGVVVSDDTLTQAVIKLRKALGDSAKNARYIQTVPKRGYRLCTEVRLRQGAAGETRSNTSGSRRLYAFLGLVVFLLVLSVIYFSPGETPPPEKVVSVESVPTLTVHPFVLLGGDKTQAYLAQGLTFDLITDLSKLSGLWVIGSRSIMGQKSDEPGKTAARYQASGEVQRMGDQLRVHVHLFDSDTGRQIWSERYHRPFDNLFQIQEEISSHIASTLSLKVSEAELQRLSRRYTNNVQAYEYFLRAQSLLLVRQKEENGKARQLYRQAIDQDPGFARAYAGLALSIAADYRNQWVPDTRVALENARSMARTALQIDSEIPEVYWVLAYVSAQQRQHDKAIELLDKAISLDRSFADAYALKGGVSTYMGRTEDTPQLIRAAMRLNPEAGYLYYMVLGRAYFFLQEWDQALINLHQALERNSASLEAHIYLAAVLESSGDQEGAAWEAEEILALQEDFNLGRWLLTYPMTDEGQRESLLNTLSPLGLNKR